MEYQQTVTVKAPVRDVAEHIEAYLKAPPAEGSAAKAQLDQAGVDYASIAQEITKIGARHYRATAQLQGLKLVADYRFKAIAGQTEVAVTGDVDLTPVLGMVRDQARAEAGVGNDPELRAAFEDEFDAFLAAEGPGMLAQMGAMMKPALEASLNEWGDLFPAYIAQQKTVGGGSTPAL